MEEEIKNILLQLGEDPEREGLKKTPERVRKSLEYLTRGYQQDLEKVVNGAIFEVESQDMVIVRDIEFYSMCEHHMLPFFGKCSIGYIPKGKIFDCVETLRDVCVEAPVQIGDVILENVAGTGVDIVATGNVKQIIQ